MKKNIALILLSMLSLTAYADFSGNGYYRVQNYGTQRWATIVDNTGSIDWTATTADLNALQLIKNKDMIIGDAGSILYISNVAGSEYNVAAQGTSIQDIMDYNLKLREDGSSDGQKLYRAYGTYQGVTKYLSDANKRESDNYGQAMLSSSTTSTNYVKWFIKPIDVNSDNYFGITPNVTSGEGSYATLYTSFPYSIYSSGMKAYYIGRVGKGMAEIIEINGAVAENTPVIIKCAGSNLADNKFNVGTAASAVKGNSLKGTYFNSHIGGHENYVAYNPVTMRVLGVCADGSLGFVTSNIDYIPANTAYLVVSEDTPAELKCVTTEYYDEHISDDNNPDEPDDPNNPDNPDNPDDPNNPDNPDVPDDPEPIYPEKLYMMGSFQNWDFNSSEYVLTPDASHIYSTTVNFPVEADSDIYFRFYSELGDANKGSIGANTDSKVNVPVNFNESGFYSGVAILDAQGCWVIEKWNGNDVSLQLDYVNMTLSVSTELSGIGQISNNTRGLSLSNGKVYAADYTTFMIMDASGRIITEKVGNEFDLSGLKSGMYIINAKGYKPLKIAK